MTDIELEPDDRASRAYQLVEEGASNALGWVWTTDYDEAHLARIERIDYDSEQGNYFALLSYEGEGWGRRYITMSLDVVYPSPSDAFRDRLWRTLMAKTRPSCFEDGCTEKLHYAAPDLSMFGCSRHPVDAYGDGMAWDIPSGQIVHLPPEPVPA